MCLQEPGRGLLDQDVRLQGKPSLRISESPSAGPRGSWGWRQGRRGSRSPPAPPTWTSSWGCCIKKPSPTLLKGPMSLPLCRVQQIPETDRAPDSTMHTAGALKMLCGHPAGKSQAPGSPFDAQPPARLRPSKLLFMYLTFLPSFVFHLCFLFIWFLVLIEKDENSVSSKRTI